MHRLSLFAILILLSAAASLAAIDGFTNTQSTGDEIVIEWALPDFSIDTDGAAVRIVTDTNTWTGEYGSPELPLFSTLAGLPDRGACSLEWEIIEEEWLNVTPVPFQEPEAPLWFDPAVYEGGGVYPAMPFELTEPAIMRNRRVGGLNIAPFRWHARESKLQVIRRARLTINTDSSSRGANEIVSPKPASRTFENIFAGSMVNYESLPLRDEFQQPCILFITYNTTISNTIGLLTMWKHMMGYEVHTVTMSTTGSSATSIKNYIQNAYDNWANPPEFVVLVGDASGTYGVPTWYHSWVRYNGEGDHPYALLDGADQIEDICIGRLSFSSTSQLQVIQSKVLKYEREPYMTQTAWYNDNLLVGDTTPSGISCISTNKYIKELMTTYSGTHSFTEIYGGNPSPSQMDNALNAGTLYFNYRGWIGMSGWGTSNIGNLTNTNKLPVSVILTCDTGSFASGTSRTEALLREGTTSAPQGGICAVGMATSGTHTAYNNCLDGGIFEGLFSQDMRTMGEAMQRGKTYLWQTYNNSQPSKVQAHSHICNLMGDPSLQVWKTLPKALNASYPSSLTPQAEQIVVEVTRSNGTPLANAWVTVLKGNDTIFATGYTDAGGYIVLPITTGQSGTVDLTVTCPGYIPHLGSFTITTNAPGLQVSDQIFDDDQLGGSSGNNDGVVNPGETIEWKLELENIGNLSLTSVSVLLRALDTDWVSVSDDSESWGSIAQGQSVWNTEDFDFTINPACPGGTVIRFLLQITSSQYTVNQIVEVTVEGPALQLYQCTIDDNGNGVLDPGDNAQMWIILHNDGSIGSTSMTATISCNDDRINFTVDTATYNAIQPGLNGTNASAFEVSAEMGMLPGSIVTIQLDLSGSLGEAAVVSFPLTIGNPTQTDPLGPDSYGYAIFDSFDTSYNLAPIYDWVEIDPSYGGSGTNLNLNDTGGDQDDVTVFTIPFEASFYGKPYSTLSVCSNGWFSFDATEQITFRNWRMPGPIGPAAQVAVFWDDLRMGSGDAYRYHDAANHRYIIQWSRMINAAGSSPETFQAIIYDPAYYPTPTGDSEIKLQYMTVNNVDAAGYNDHGCYATVGIEDHTGLRGIEYTFDNEYPPAARPLANGLALFITTRQPVVQAPPIAVIDTTPISIFLQPGATGNRTLNIANDGEATLQYSVNPQFIDRDQGGPDTFGYTWIDSNEPGGPDYVWTDIQTSGTSVSLSDDQMSGLLNIGFSFPFYGNSYTQLRICSNGYVSFTDTDTDWSNDPIPDTTAPNNIIAPFWDDLSPHLGGTIHYYSDTANNRFTVQFTDVDHYPGVHTGDYTFQMQILAGGAILFYYQDLNGDIATNTIGIENSNGTDGLEIAYNATYAQDGLAIEIGIEPEWMDVTPLSGIVENGQPVDLQLDIDTADLNLGDYNCDLYISTNDPNNPLFIVPVALHVVNQVFPPQSPQDMNIVWWEGSAWILWSSVTEDTGGNPVVVTHYNIYRGPIGAELTATPENLYGTATDTFFEDTTPQPSGNRYIVTAVTAEREIALPVSPAQQ
ncbi:MAG: hypothetical protein K8R90_00925 [Candidatus Cloacimonetes bacterium]|nr:hypothetical protein [Candidatus Cloacimonadota bacterium]